MLENDNMLQPSCNEQTNHSRHAGQAEAGLAKANSETSTTDNTLQATLLKPPNRIIHDMDN